MMSRAKKGVEDEGETLKALDVWPGKKEGEYYMLMGEGKKREVRRIFKALGGRYNQPYPRGYRPTET